MEIFNGCLLASDIDGTLEENGIINPRVIDRKNFFISEGGSFSLATGRAVPAVRNVIEKIGNVSPSVLLNGSVIYDLINNKVLWELSIPNEELELAFEIYRSLPGIAIELCTASEVYFLRTNNELRIHDSNEHFESIRITPEKLKNMKIDKILYAAEDPALLNAVDNFIASTVHTSVFRSTTAFFEGKQRYYLEQLPAGASKSEGCRKLKEILNIPEGGYFAIGDYYNDLDMVADSDIGCFTAAAPEELRMQADYVSGSAKDGAVADFIDYLAENRC